MHGSKWRREETRLQSTQVAQSRTPPADPTNSRFRPDLLIEVPANGDDADSGVRVLRVAAEPQGCLWDDLLAVAVGVRALPQDLAVIDVLLADAGVYEPIREFVAPARQRAWDVGADGGPPDGRDGDVRAVDGAQDAHRLGL